MTGGNVAHVGVHMRRAQWQWQSDCPLVKVKRETQRHQGHPTMINLGPSRYEKEISLPDMNVVVGFCKAYHV